jgi:GNAT superfamily N-acetyltransferase
MRTEITTWYLEIRTPGELRPKRSPRTDLLLSRLDDPAPEVNRFFYTAVGGGWYWIDRLGWTWAKWMQYLSRAELETWVLSAGGLPAGYFELEKQPGDDVEVAYFGLLERYTGQGLGGHLLTAAVERAWQWGARRVWLHTCSLDHPQALCNYQARGFRLYKEEVHAEDLPEEPPGPWPGAGRRRADARATTP